MRGEREITKVDERSSKGTSVVEGKGGEESV